MCRNGCWLFRGVKVDNKDDGGDGFYWARKTYSENRDGSERRLMRCECLWGRGGGACRVRYGWNFGVVMKL